VIVALGCYVAGAAVGFGVTRSGTPGWWRHLVRAQMLAVGTTLAVVAGWKLRVDTSLAQAAGVAACVYVLFAVAALTRARRSVGESLLEAWAAAPNTGFWIIPIATVLGGPTATVLAVTADQLATPLIAFSVNRLRRDAPTPQQTSTAFTDYAPMAGLAAGVALGRLVPAPSWTAVVLMVLGPVLAVTGAAMWAGSLRHLVGRLGAPTAPDWRRWALLTATRVVLYGSATVLFWGSPAALVAVLGALSAPTFNPPNATVLYGYPSQVASIAARWGWLAAPFGLAAAAIAAG
jgi:hypothetical protein